jgi:hypothetical protein
MEKKNDRNYFTKDTDEAIKLYNETDCTLRKNKIYEEHIHYPFFKLTQNIIHTFKFYNTDVDDLEHLQHEIIVFLLSKIHMFDPSLGFKGYSYFGTIVKRWLILYDRNNYNKKINSIPIDSIKENFPNNDETQISKDRLSKYINEFVKYVDFNLYKLFPKEEDAKVADAILEIFKKRDFIENFNKKAIYIYIREMIETKTSRITKVSKKLYKTFKRGYIQYLEHDFVEF